MKYLIPLSVTDGSTFGLRTERIVRVFGITVYSYLVISK